MPEAAPGKWELMKGRKKTGLPPCPVVRVAALISYGGALG